MGLRSRYSKDMDGGGTQMVGIWKDGPARVDQDEGNGCGWVAIAGCE